MSHIMLKHLSGSRAGQTSEFPLPQTTEITLGRDPASSVSFDPAKDDLVGRYHAKITPDHLLPGQFTVSDLNSRNGTFINKQRISGSARVTPGDVIQLGAGGPEFEFEVLPRPAPYLQPTREASAVGAVGATPSATVPFPLPPTTTAPTVDAFSTNQNNGNRKVATNATPPPLGHLNAPRQASYQPLNNQAVPPSPFNAPSTNAAPLPPRPAGVGQATVERLITQTRRDMGKLMLIGGGALVLVLALAAWKFWPNAPAASLLPLGDPTLLTPGQVAEKYSGAVVSIDVRWKLINTNTGRQISHVYVPNRWKDKEGVERPIINDGRREVATYIVLDGGAYEPTLDDRGGAHAIGGGGGGSGFVVSSDGFILTARHVGAGWMSRYQYPADASPGVVWTQGANGWTLRTNPETGMPVTYSIPANWAPSETRQFGRDGYRWAVEGRLDFLNVTFPQNKTSIPGKLARVSDRHDVAMLKIDMPEAVPKTELNDNYDTIKVGDPITVLGYPAASPISWGLVNSMDAFNRESQMKVVPDPSLTTGNIGRVLRSQESGKDKTTNEFGDAYQVTANPGAGNSGGPVFDDHGRVVGIYYAGRAIGAGGAQGQVSFAVPIRFARELMTTTPK
ncbi:MAG: trypsin-like peptidase domain-containing protein [Acidobacteria bacterium]|nr:trypsin-like peptidase domain-containing protein [Acidobacteriota bacterium]MBI3428041.1 trypsin-like peptidase domain-containing protein [Acidobacteriota bacterium]